MIIKLILFFYLSSTYLSATHIHHEKLNTLDGCKVHFLVKNLNSSDLPDGRFELLECMGCFESILCEAPYRFHTIHKGFDAHAPPSFF